MRRLLVVDDDCMQIDLLRSLLDGLNVEIVAAPDGITAFNEFMRQPCHAILSDLNMPVANGIDLLRKIRSVGFDVPFVLLTAFASEDNIKQALRLGATDLLEKPYNVKELVNAVENALQIGYRTERIRELSRTPSAGATEMTQIEQQQKMISVMRWYRARS